MPGDDQSSGRLFSHIDLEGPVSACHPMRVVREIVNEVFCSMSGERPVKAKGGTRRITLAGDKGYDAANFVS